MKEYFERLGEKINFGKRYPQYICKPVFRSMLVLIFAIVIINVWLSSGDLSGVSMTCPESAEVGCKNPFYGTSHCVDNNQKYYCDTEYFPAGTEIGRQDIFMKHSVLMMLLLFLGSFVVNHIIYGIKTKDWSLKELK